ncbi:MAG: hypothetical protein AAF721_10445 [Myxococcota bacterium]
MRRTLWPRVLLAASLVVACSDRQIDPMMEGDESEDGMLGDPGVRPSSPGSMYSACTDTAVCAPLEFCVFPQGEAGFCTAACGPDNDASACDAAPGEDRDPVCMDIGLPDGRTVCALGCDGLSCPRQMRCEEVDAASGAQLACF